MLLAVPVPVRADEAAEAAEAYARGQKLFEEQRYVGAAAAFERAYELRPHYRVQCSIALCYQKIRNMVEAAEHYRKCLKEGGDADSGMAERVRTSLKAAEAQITWVEVKSPGKGGTVYVDGTSAGEAPRWVALNPGTHLLEVRREGAEAAKSTVKTLGSEERELTLIPVELAPVKPKKPDETVTKPGKSRRRLSQVWFWAAVGVTAALAATMAVMGVQTVGLKNDFNDDPTDDAADKFYQRRKLTNIFLGLAGAAAAGTTVLFFYTDFGRKEAEGAQALGVGLRGTF